MVSTKYKLLIDPITDVDSGKVTWSFFEEFGNLIDVDIFIHEASLTEYRIIKYTWEDITEFWHSKK